MPMRGPSCVQRATSGAHGATVMLPHTIEYHIADVGDAWGIFREGMQIAVRKDPVDAIAFANYFADRETLMSPHPVHVMADVHLYRTLQEIRDAA